MVVISIHALREEGDASARSNAFMPSNFYPRPPRGGRPAAIAGRCRAADFYPRPPRGGRRAVGGVIVRRSRISIHALREEGDRFFRCGETQIETISIHALREEGDTFTRCSPQPCGMNFYPRPPRGGRLGTVAPTGSGLARFLSTPSARRATRHKPQEVLYDYYFYPRPPRGGRRFTGCPTRRGQKISIHALREEGDTTFTPRLAPERYFYPRPPRGGRPTGASANNAYELFLSTPSARRATIAFSIGATFS